MLWDDNRKLKTMESEKIRELEKKMLGLEFEKQQEIKYLQKKSNKRMEKEMSLANRIRQQEENSVHELKKIIRDRITNCEW